jgi:NTP pyrophosphatase (non-canonical NTP hydrolase)
MTITAAVAGDENGIYQEIRAERERAHAKHQTTSMEQRDVAALVRLAVLVEEIGEVAREFNEARHRGEERPDLAALRTELIQVAALAATWADNIGGHRLPLAAAGVET